MVLTATDEKKGTADLAKTQAAAALKRLDLRTADAFSTLSESVAAFETLSVFDAKNQSEGFIAFAQRSFRELFNIKFALASFVVNNLRRRYRRSVLGFAWSLINPLMTMGVMTLVFSIIFKQNPREFGVYVFTGLLPWSFFLDSVLIGSGSITAAESFLKKVYIPKLFFPMVTVSTEGANFVFSLLSLTLLSFCIGAPMHATALLVVPVFALLFAFAFSVGLFFAVATVYFRDLGHILRVSLGALFYTVPVVYPMSLVPQQFRFVYDYNPLSRFVELFRICICEGKVPGIDVWAVPIGATIACAIAALLVLKKTERDLIYRL